MQKAFYHFHEATFHRYELSCHFQRNVVLQKAILCTLFVKKGNVRFLLEESKNLVLVAMMDAFGMKMGRQRKLKKVETKFHSALAMAYAGKRVSEPV